MYWVYVIIFTFVVFVPRLVSHGIFGFDVIQTQQYAILLLGIVATLAFHYLESLLKKSKEEKSTMQRNVSRMTKELTNSYSYIGEVNRKIDILEHITLGLPETADLALKHWLELYQPIMAAIKLFGKSDDFILRFIDCNTRQVLKEIKSPAAVSQSFLRQDCVRDVSFIENKEFIVANSSRTIDSISACIVIRKKKLGHANNDPEMLKMIATQALFLFMLLQYKNSRNIKST